MIKPMCCPHCGSEEILIEKRTTQEPLSSFEGGFLFYVSCDNCGRGQEFKGLMNPKEIISYWNEHVAYGKHAGAPIMIDANVQTDAIDHPDYYQGGRECIDEMLILFGVDAVISFCKCNAYKYRYRAGRKPGESAEKDLKKAEWYLTKAAELLSD